MSESTSSYFAGMNSSNIHKSYPSLSAGFPPRLPHRGASNPDEKTQELHGFGAINKSCHGFAAKNMDFHCFFPTNHVGLPLSHQVGWFHDFHGIVDPNTHSPGSPPRKKPPRGSHRSAGRATWSAEWLGYLASLGHQERVVEPGPPEFSIIQS